MAGSPNAAGVILKHGAGGGIEADSSFKENNLSTERVRANEQGSIRTQDRFKFSFQMLTVGWRDSPAAKRIPCAIVNKSGFLQIHLTLALRDSMSFLGLHIQAYVCAHISTCTHINSHTHMYTLWGREDTEIKIDSHPETERDRERLIKYFFKNLSLLCGWLIDTFFPILIVLCRQHIDTFSPTLMLLYG